MKDYEIKKVLVRKDGVKYIIIPKCSEMKVGDYVIITKMEDKINGEGRKRNK